MVDGWPPGGSGWQLVPTLPRVRAGFKTRAGARAGTRAEHRFRDFPATGAGSAAYRLAMTLPRPTQTRALGTAGPSVAPIGIGLMGMSDHYGAADDAESVATIQAALDAGVTLVDTADFYGSGHNEMLLAEALRGRRREDVVISGKFGLLRDPAGGWAGIDNRPGSVKNFLAYSLRRLGTDYIDIYRPARLDPAVPIEETMKALAQLVRKGHIRHIGLSEVGADTLRRAHAVHPVSDLQIEYSMFSRGIEHEILPTARELGIGITAYGTLSRGLLSGHWSAPAAPEPDQARGPGRDIRSRLPRFTGENLSRNLDLVEDLRMVAEAKGVTVVQLAIAWVLSRGPDIVPVIGARTRTRLAESLAAAEVVLTPDDLADLEDAVPLDAVAGTRYEASQMKVLDSER